MYTIYTRSYEEKKYIRNVLRVCIMEIMLSDEKKNVFKCVVYDDQNLVLHRHVSYLAPRNMIQSF